MQVSLRKFGVASTNEPRSQARHVTLQLTNIRQDAFPSSRGLCNSACLLECSALRGDPAKAVVVFSTKKTMQAGLPAIACVVMLNTLFFVLALCQSFSSNSQIVAHVQQSFASGDLGSRDFLIDDAKRGNNQYNDCMIIQLAINKDSETVASRAMAPVAYTSDNLYSDVCGTLQRLVLETVDKRSLYSDHYARYWHGYVVLAAFLLDFLDVGHLRMLLRAFVVCSLAAVAISGFSGASGGLRSFGVAVGFTGLVCSGLPYFGQGLSTAPGDGVVFLGLALAISLQRRLQEPARLVVFSAAYGSLVTYFDFLTGQIPIAVCLLFVVAYFTANRDCSISDSHNAEWRPAFAAAFSFALGSIATVLLKQVLAVALAGPQVLDLFVANLSVDPRSC